MKILVPSEMSLVGPLERLIISPLGPLDKHIKFNAISDAPRWVDNFIMLIFGGLPWQAYFQRVLSANSANNARIQSVCAGFACMFMAIPSIFIGATAKATDWDLIFAQEANETRRPPMKILVSRLLFPSIRWVRNFDPVRGLEEVVTCRFAF